MEASAMEAPVMESSRRPATRHDHEEEEDDEDSKWSKPQVNTPWKKVSCASLLHSDLRVGHKVLDSLCGQFKLLLMNWVHSCCEAMFAIVSLQ